MGPLTILGEALNLTQLVGFTARNHRTMQGITVATGVAQLLLGLFAGGGGHENSTASIVIATGDRIIKAIQDLNSQLDDTIKSAFQSQYMAKLSTAQDQLKSTIEIFLNMEGPESLSPSTLKTLEKSFANWRASITEPIVISSESGVKQALNWAIANEGNDYSTFPLYLLAAALYLNYCKLGIGLEYHEMCVNWSKNNASKPNPDPVPTQEDLKGGIYYKKLVEAFKQHDVYSSPRVARISAGNDERSKAVLAIGKSGTARKAVDRGKAYDKMTEKHHLGRVTDDVALLIEQTYKGLMTAKDQWDGNLF